MLSKFVIATAFCALPLVAAHAAPRQTAGTLACSVETDDDRVHQISCKFQPSGGGAAARYTGAIARLGPNERLDASRVLVWLVLGPPELELDDLQGRFVRKNPPGNAAAEGFKESLIGGTGDAIALVPPSGREQIPGNAALTVLELNLSALKT